MKHGALVVTFFLFLLLALSVTGCNDQKAPRSRLLVVRIAETDVEADTYTYVYLSDVAHAGADGIPGTEDDAVVEDETYLTLENQPRNSLLTIDPLGPYGAVVLTGYRVDYLVPGSDVIDPIEAGMNLVVHMGKDHRVITRIVLVTAISKTQPPLSTLATGGELLVTAKITLTGYEETSKEDIEAVAYMQIHFANWTDPD